MKPGLVALLLIFTSLFVYQAVLNITTSPFHEFDEVHRAENAKRMKEYNSIVPLTGSPFDRNIHLREPFRDNSDVFLYYHLERPGLVYWLMVGSISMFGENKEWAYRIPSFIFGLLTIACFWFFSRKYFLPGLVGLLALLTSVDLWQSAQYAQLDTGLTFFLFLAVLFLTRYLNNRTLVHLACSGLAFGGAVLSKGQPAVIFLIPVVYLFVIKKLKFTEVIKLFAFSGIVLIPWLIAVSLKFGFGNFIQAFTSFATTSASIEYFHHKSPFFWYGRWWLESFRLGWVLFLSLAVFDFVNHKLDQQKKVWLVYILGSLALVSAPVNKVWWYALPLIPPVCFYIYLSSRDYLEKKPVRALNLTGVLLLCALPIGYQTSNKVALAMGGLLTLAGFFILRSKIGTPEYLRKGLMLIAIMAILGSFYLRFPKIIPYNENTKPVAMEFAKITGVKCLYHLDLPPESIIFYSQAGEVKPYFENLVLNPNCQNYLISTREVFDKQKVFERGDVKLFRL
jgi:4-amino-4-deoxy-L-arabinose transferase-like glycosyltransferase